MGPEEVQEVADTPVEYQGRRLVWTVTLPMAQHSKCGSLTESRGKKNRFCSLQVAERLMRAVKIV